jgi:hypothetical protein
MHATQPVFSGAGARRTSKKKKRKLSNAIITLLAIAPSSERMTVSRRVSNRKTQVEKESTQAEKVSTYQQKLVISRCSNKNRKIQSTILDTCCGHKTKRG